MFMFKVKLLGVCTSVVFTLVFWTLLQAQYVTFQFFCRYLLFISLQ